MLNIDDRLIKEVSPKIGPNALSVLFAIAIHLNQKTNRAFPSHNRLMELTGIGRDAVYSALSTLKKHGLLSSYQPINSETKTFGRRQFKVSTDFIKIFISAQDAEPLPEKPYTGEPYTGEPYTENQETYQISNDEQINQLEQIKEPEQKAGKEKNSPLEDDKKNTPPSSAAPPQSKKHKEGTPGYYAADFKDNYLIKDAYSMSRLLPMANYLTHLRNWYIEASAQEQKYDCRKSAMNHFLAFAESREKYKAPKSSQIKKTNTLDYDDPETQPF